jgi:hypothetical protein
LAVFVSISLVLDILLRFPQILSNTINFVVLYSSIETKLWKLITPKQNTMAVVNADKSPSKSPSQFPSTHHKLD